MADNKQSMKALQGITTPELSGLNKLLLNNNTNMTASTQATVSPSGSEYIFSIAQGAQINGVFIVKFTLASGNVSAVISCSARAVNGVEEINQISFITSQSETPSVAELSTAEIRENSTASEIALILRVKTTSTVSATVNVTSLGDSITQVNTNPLPVWTIAGQYSQIDSRATVNFKFLPIVNVDLNAIVTPGAVSCNPALTGSYPNATGYGTCMTFGSVNSGTLAQIFIGTDGAAWTRSSDAGRTWGTWKPVLNATTQADILDSASATAMIWSIVMA